MLIAAGAMEGLTSYLVHFLPSAIPSKDRRSSNDITDLFVLVVNASLLGRSKTNEERIRCESDLKRIYIYAARAIQTQDQTNLSRYALVKGKGKRHHSTERTDRSFLSGSGVVRAAFDSLHRISLRRLPGNPSVHPSVECS